MKRDRYNLSNRLLVPLNYRVGGSESSWQYHDMGYNLFPLKFFSNFLGRATTRGFSFEDVSNNRCWLGEGGGGRVHRWRQKRGICSHCARTPPNHSVIKIHFADSSVHTAYPEYFARVRGQLFIRRKIAVPRRISGHRFESTIHPSPSSLPALPSFLITR